MEVIVIDLLLDIRNRYQNDTSIDRDNKALAAFAFVFYDDQSTITSALELIDSIEIVKYQLNNHSRHYYLVTGSRNIEYIVLERFCQCRHYFEMSKTSRHPYCKHLVAMCVAVSIGKFKEIIIGNDAFCEALCKINDYCNFE